MTDALLDTPAVATTPAPAGDAAAAVAAAGTPVTPVVPESYTFTMPDGTRLDSKVTDRITDRAKALKITDGGVAQAMLDVAHGEVNEVLAAYEAAHREGGSAYVEMMQANAAAALAHPDLGNGSAQVLEQKALENALVMNRYAGGTELVAKLKAAGLLNDPVTMRFVQGIHAATKERGSPVGGDVRAAEVSWGQAMYPDGILVDTGAKTAL